MDLIDLIILLAATVGVIAYICRLDALRLGRHALVVILLHASLGISCIFAGYHAWSGETGALDIAAVIGSLSWIWMSLPTWGKGAVPKQFETKPAPLDEQAARRVVGGSKERP